MLRAERHCNDQGVPNTQRTLDPVSLTPSSRLNATSIVYLPAWIDAFSSYPRDISIFCTDMRQGLGFPDSAIDTCSAWVIAL